MITLEQVQKLDAKIKQAVSLIGTLREENAQLRSTLSNYENKINELESIVLTLEDGQTKIELSLMDAISKLDNLDIVENREEESIEKLSPSEETAIVNNDNIDENDHSKQAENITVDSLSLDVISEPEGDEVISDIEVKEDVTLAEENSDEAFLSEDEIINDSVIENETDEIIDNSDIESETDELTDETDNNTIIDEETEELTDEIILQEDIKIKKKSNDYSIPMLEIF